MGHLPRVGARHRARCDSSGPSEARSAREPAARTPLGCSPPPLVLRVFLLPFLSADDPPLTETKHQHGSGDAPAHESQDPKIPRWRPGAQGGRIGGVRHVRTPNLFGDSENGGKRPQLHQHATTRTQLHPHATTRTGVWRERISRGGPWRQWRESVGPRSGRAGAGGVTKDLNKAGEWHT